MSRSKISVEDQEVNTDVNFVSRWSKLKHENSQNSEANLGYEAAVDEAVSDETAENKTSTQDGVSDEEQQAAVKILTDEDMPAIESMTADSDYTDFLSPGVSEELRNLALRKLFLSEVFNIRDGLDEYDGDYTHFESLGDIVTADMKHQLELEAKRKTEQLLQHEERLNDDDSPDDELIDENRVDGDSPKDYWGEDARLVDDSTEGDRVDGSQGNEQDHLKNNHNKNAAEISTKKLDENTEYIDLKINKTDKDTG